MYSLSLSLHPYKLLAFIILWQWILQGCYMSSKELSLFVLSLASSSFIWSRSLTIHELGNCPVSATLQFVWKPTRLYLLKVWHLLQVISHNSKEWEKFFWPLWCLLHICIWKWALCFSALFTKPEIFTVSIMIKKKKDIKSKAQGNLKTVLCNLGVLK